ncbi:hypothetical protein [Streptomyces sp. UNOC14_S4]|uniref:hypothetical protein n=1 Tax=Streptomyces sp. UNOC14_S4 TaxID=2872340 RepID=UPI001E34689B|nr:hypothetical protein [Streptomyces sp. UNOC14_S4]MCC3766025.1 hypothetical protein [Streptomyces sp. UNOC14_S4]
MIYRKLVTERYNMGSGEHIEVSVEVQCDSEANTINDIEETINYLLVPERLLARKHAEETSFIHTHPGLTRPHHQRM